MSVADDTERLLEEIQRARSDAAAEQLDKLAAVIRDRIEHDVAQLASSAVMSDEQIVDALRMRLDDVPDHPSNRRSRDVAREALTQALTFMRRAKSEPLAGDRARIREITTRWEIEQRALADKHEGELL